MKALSMKAVIALSAVFVLVLNAAVAQPQGQQVRIRGTVQKLDGQKLTVESQKAGTITVTMAPNIGINGLEKQSLSDIDDGNFIGTTATKGQDGRWKAVEVHIFPESMRGAGEGHYPWDMPGSTMTNANVSGTTKIKDGRTLELAYDGGQVEVDVMPDTPIVRFIPGDRSLLEPGAKVFVLAAKGEDGTINAFAITAETNGVEPPM